MVEPIRSRRRCRKALYEALSPDRGLGKGSSILERSLAWGFLCLSVVLHLQIADFIASLSMVLFSHGPGGPHHAVDTCQSNIPDFLCGFALRLCPISLPRVSTSDILDGLAVRMPVVKLTAAAVAAVVLVVSTPGLAVGA